MGNLRPALLDRGLSTICIPRSSVSMKPLTRRGVRDTPHVELHARAVGGGGSPHLSLGFGHHDI